MAKITKAFTDYNYAPSPPQISYWLQSGSPSTAKHIVAQATELTWLLTDLAIYSDYAITVRALNLAGEGPPSGAVYAKTKEGGRLL